MKLRALQFSLVGVAVASLVVAFVSIGTGQDTATKPRKVVKTDAEWRKQLTREQYMVTRQAWTEPAFSGKLYNNHAKGLYECIGCETELFASKTKFESGTGWPSFYAPFDKKNVDAIADPDGSGRVEVRCNTCGAHLGHVFDDGPAPTGLRYCMNSAALKFVKETPAEAKPADKKKTEKLEKKKETEKTEKVEKTETPAKDAPTTETPK